MGRKILATGGKILEPLVQEIREFCAANTGNVYADQTQESLEQLLNLTQAIGEASGKNPDEVNAAAVDYLMHAGYTTIAYFWAKAAVVAQQALNSGASETAFYQSKLATAQFYFERLLPRTETLSKTMLSGADNLTTLDEDAFIF